MSEMQAIVKEFLVESSENLDQLDRDLVELEKNPASKELLARIFRTVHSIKGATGFLGFEKLGAVAHVGENLLSHLREGALLLNPEITSGLLALVDAIRKMLSEIEAQGQEAEADYSALVNTLTRLQGGGHVGKDPPPLPPLPLAAETSVTDRSPFGHVALSSGADHRPGSASAHGGQKEPAHDVDAAPQPSAASPDKRIPAAKPPRERKEAGSLSASGESLRVDVRLLDNLMNLVGELVLARNQILQVCSRQEDAAFLATSQRLNLITSELQEGVTKVRMQPIEIVWQKFPRLVRDLALQCAKQVRLEMMGEETELDKAIVEAIQDPLTHLVRNAVDHGIEAPEVRRAKGKPAEGCLLLRAFHENGQVSIEISDDGAGIDLDHVRQIAVSRRLITPEKARLLDDRETMNLIFLPNFSTATAVTSVSGRGVGMDVVKTNIGRIGGTLDIQSKLGAGTTIRMRIPLTLAIVPALLIRAGGDRYAIPQVSVVELVRLDKSGEESHIDRIQDVVIYRLRERLLPLVFLDAEPQGRASPSAAALDVATNTARTIVVLQTQDRQFGLVVDQVNDTEEIVVRPLGQQLKSVSIYAGATILGDGRVALVLDVPGLAARACLPAQGDERAQASRAGESQDIGPESIKLLLSVDLNDERVAVPLSQVTRLEEFPRSRVERTGRQEVLQYGNEILPLFTFSGLPADGQRGRSDANREGEENGKIQVVVCRQDGRALGLVVGRVLDIVEHELTNPGSSSREGMCALTVIEGRITRILDLEEIFRSIVSGPPRSPVGVEAGVGT